MKTGTGQPIYRNLTLFHVLWSVPVKVFLTVTFSILSILTDQDLFGSDVEEDCSYTVFAVVFLTLTKHNTKELHVWRGYQTDFVREHLSETISGDFCMASLFQVSIHVNPCHPLPQTTGNTSIIISKYDLK